MTEKSCQRQCNSKMCHSQEVTTPTPINLNPHKKASAWAWDHFVLLSSIHLSLLYSTTMLDYSIFQHVIIWWLMHKTTKSFECIRRKRLLDSNIQLRKVNICCIKVFSNFPQLEASLGVTLSIGCTPFFFHLYNCVYATTLWSKYTLEILQYNLSLWNGDIFGGILSLCVFLSSCLVSKFRLFHVCTGVL